MYTRAGGDGKLGDLRQSYPGDNGVLHPSLVRTQDPRDVVQV